MGIEEKGNKNPDKLGLGFFIMVLAASVNGGVSISFFGCCTYFFKSDFSTYILNLFR